jgi:hypothetical protein
MFSVRAEPSTPRNMNQKRCRLSQLARDFSSCLQCDDHSVNTFAKKVNVVERNFFFLFYFVLEEMHTSSYIMEDRL